RGSTPAAPRARARRTHRERRSFRDPWTHRPGLHATSVPLPCYTLAVHDDLEQRKSQHLDLVQRDEVEPESADPLFDCVHLIHRALPELSLDEVDLSTDLCGRALKAPLIITGMTGGTERAGQINRDLAALAQETGVAFGVGSMRVLLDQPDLLPTFAVQSPPPLLLP